MGLDIRVATDIDNSSDIVSKSFDYRLSRTFCTIIARYYGVSSNSEIGQISKLAKVDITRLMEMDKYPYGDGFDYSVIENEDERQRTIANAFAIMEKLKGNIDEVLFTIKALIEAVSKIENLPSLLGSSEYEVSVYLDYFGDFDKDKGDGYIGNNFGQDLRNFKQFLELAKIQGATTVWFDYG